VWCQCTIIPSYVFVVNHSEALCGILSESLLRDIHESQTLNEISYDVPSRDVRVMSCDS